MKVFNYKCAQAIIKKFQHADVVFLIPHVKDLHSIIEGIHLLLSQKGTAVIEFHYAKVIQDELQL